MNSRDDGPHGLDGHIDPTWRPTRKRRTHGSNSADILVFAFLLIGLALLGFLLESSIREAWSWIRQTFQ